MTNPFLFALIASIYCISVSAQQPAVKTANELVPPFTSTFGYGSNMMGQGNGWTDQTTAGVVSKAGCTTLRATLPDDFIQTWGVNVRLSAFQTYTTTLNMKDLVCFVQGPSAAHKDQTVYPGNTTPSKLFANLYTPIWNADGSVNQNNYYAYYIYHVVQTYGPYIHFWEVVNEPDITYNADVSQWLTRAPLPSETPNTQAPFFNYVRMLRITWEVVKKYYPNEYVTTGGIGYDTYLDALMRYTDNPTDGSVTSQYPYKGGAYFDVVSYHVYPSWFLRYWNNSIGNFSYTQNSDYAAAQVIKIKNQMDAVLQKYGYIGSPYPKKYYIVTETNIGRRTSDWRYGTEEMQRNFGIKTMVLAQKNDIKQIHYYGVSESITAPPAGTSVASGDESKLMGLYENLQRDPPGSEKITQLGVGNRTTSHFLNGYSYDGGATAALNLPSNVEGGAFVKGGAYVYVLWAKNPNDKTETYSVNYSFPTALNISTVQRFEWNYSSTGSSATPSSQDLTLNTTPSFFKVSTTGPTTTNAIPVANAGAAQSITLPANTATLDGSVSSDANGTVASYSWSETSGPNTANFSSGTTAQKPTVTGLVAGSYVFSLLVTDNAGAVSKPATVTVTVNASAAVSSTTSASGSPVYRINAGGPQVTNSIGTFAADAYYFPTPGNTFSTTTAIAGTSNGGMYQTERFGTNGTFGYAFPVTNGSYNVVLHFAELYWTSAGKRVFDVSIEGNKVLDNYDIFQNVGAFTATSKTFPVTVSDGTLNINFSSLSADGGVDQAKVSAIEILSTGTTSGSGTTTTTTSNTQALSSFTLINATNNQDIQTISNGATLNLATLPTKSLNIRANTSHTAVGSVVFSLSGTQTRSQTDTAAPYALFGDNIGTYNAWTPTVGSYTLNAIPYTGNGTAGTPLQITFNVTSQAATARIATAPEEERAIVSLDSSTNTLKAYPNPNTDGHFTVLLPKKLQGQLTYTLLSVNGTRLAGGMLSLGKPTPSTTFNFSREMNSSGIYYLKLESKDFQGQLKLMRVK